MTDSRATTFTCAFCGATEARELGECSVCHELVCEECGNVQMSQGERHVTHSVCLRNQDGVFKMIKFVN